MLDDGALVEAEEVNFIVHAGQSVRIVSNGCRGRQSRLTDKEALFRLLITRAKLLDEAIHGGCHTSQLPLLLLLLLRLRRGQTHGDRRASNSRVVKVNEHDFFLVSLLDFGLRESVKFFKLADGAARLRSGLYR